MHRKSIVAHLRWWVLAGLVGLSFGFGKIPLPKQSQTVRTVVIDAGHGGKDSGAIGKYRTREKDVVLKIALAIGERIKSNYPEIRVIYTRRSDVFIELHERGAIANRNRADLFISVHANALAGRRDYFGTETYVMGLHKTEQNLDVARRENAVVLQEENYQDKYDGFDPKSPLAMIMFENYQNAYLQSSISFASKIERQFKRVGRTSRGVKQAGFIVLWETTMPSVLVETGYLSNPGEEAFLRSENGQQQIAGAVFKAFELYKEEREN